MFCPNCGASVDGRFCQKCGSAVGAAPASSGFTAAPPVASPPVPSAGASPIVPAPAVNAGLTENAAGALCYLFGLITGVIFLAMAPYNQNPRIRFNAFQSIFFHVAFIVAWMVEWVVFMVLAMVLPYGLAAMLSLLSLVLWFGGVLIWLLLMWKAYQGQSFSLPIIGDIARKQAGA